MIFPESLQVPPLKEALRLDLFLIEQFPETSRAFWRKNLLDLVRVDGLLPKKGSLLHGNETLSFLKTSVDFFEIPPSFSIQIHYEDPHFLIVEKPSGISMYPLKAGEQNTLVQALVPRYPELLKVSPRAVEAGLLHRLDRETSGLVLLARHREVYDFFRNEFEAHRVEKEYRAWVEGVFSEKAGVLDQPIQHHPKNKKKMQVSVEGRPAHTQYEVLDCDGKNSILKIQITTGVRHQIRVHLAHCGHPLLGDTLYGAKPIEPPRFFLHASRLSFRHPMHMRRVAVSSLPAWWRIESQ
ncbi:MAG: RluA family pseudouridine synthase [Deltaproteobacteria bacterium]|nr:RluA family pseudouridine synthase [Deltaproteobacteria bacterium]